MIFRKIKYSFKRRFFKFLSILIGIIILFVPFSASALSVDYEYPPFTFTDIYVFQLSQNSSPTQLNPSISHSTDGSLKFRFDSNDSSTLYGQTDILIEFNLSSDIPDGTLYSLSFDVLLTPSSNDLWVHGSGGFDSLFGAYFSSDFITGSYSLLNTNKAHCVLDNISSSVISNYTFSLQNILYIFEAPLSIEITNIELKGGYPAPDDSDINDFEDIENGLIEDTQSHFDNFFSSVTDFNGIIFNDLSFTFTAIKTYFDKFLDLPFVGKLPFVGLALGILPSLLGVAAVAGKKIL